MENYKRDIVGKAVAMSFLCHVVILTMYFAGVHFYVLIATHLTILLFSLVMGLFAVSPPSIVNFLATVLAAVTLCISVTQLPALSGMVWSHFVPYWVGVCFYVLIALFCAAGKYMVLIRDIDGTHDEER